MSNYGVFFRDEGWKMTMRLPVNPEEITRSTDVDSEEYEILKLGKVVVPGSKGLMEIELEFQLPSKPSSFVETPREFKKPDFYIDKFNEWMKDEKAVRFICTNGVSKDLSLLVILTSVEVREAAGEEGDYYVKLTLTEYALYSIRELKTNPSIIYKPPTPPRAANPPQPPYSLYTIVSGDCLWNIAKRYLGDGARWPEIYNINRPPLGGNPNLIYPGQRIKIPSR